MCRCSAPTAVRMASSRRREVTESDRMPYNPTSVSTPPTTEKPTSKFIAKMREARESSRIWSKVLTFSTAGIHGVEFALHIGHHGARIASGPHHQVLRERRCLPEAKVDLGLGGLGQIVGTGVGDYAHDLATRIRL